MKLRDGLISVAAAIALLFSISAVAGWWPFSNDLILSPMTSSSRRIHLKK